MSLVLVQHQIQNVVERRITFMKDLVKMAHENYEKQKSDYERQKAFYEEFLQELTKEKSEDIAPHFTCVFDIAKREYVVTLKLPTNLNIFKSDEDETESQGEKEEQTVERPKDRKKERSLTDNERMECTVKWLNELFTAWCFDREVKNPCGECRFFQHECGKNIPPQANFEVMEQFTGKGTVITARECETADGPSLYVSRKL